MQNIPSVVILSSHPYFLFLFLVKRCTGVGALGFAWFYFALPETRGKRLEEIEALFDSDLKGGALANRSLQRGAHVTINDEPG